MPSKSNSPLIFHFLFFILIFLQLFSDGIASKGRIVEKRQINFGTGICLFGLLPPLGGSIQYSQGSQTGPFPEGTTATIICPSGLLPNGPSSTLCMNGFWQPPLGICTTTGLGIGIGTGGFGQGQCATGPSTPLNGRVVYSNNNLVGPYPAGTIATVLCNSGFVLSGGQSTAICQNGQFSPNVFGTCVAAG